MPDKRFSLGTRVVLTDNIAVGPTINTGAKGTVLGYSHGGISTRFVAVEFDGFCQGHDGHNDIDTEVKPKNPKGVLFVYEHYLDSIQLENTTIDSCPPKRIFLDKRFNLRI